MYRVKKADGRYETIMDLMTLQDQIESFQKLIFASLRGSANNECKISALVPLVKESFGIYKFITSMLRAMHRRKLIVPYFESSWSVGTDSPDVLVPLRDRYTAQHFNLRRFYYECSNLKYLTGLINVPKLGQVSLMPKEEEIADGRNHPTWSTLEEVPHLNYLNDPNRKSPKRSTSLNGLDHPMLPKPRLRNSDEC
jgi:hypothetical protein